MISPEQVQTMIQERLARAEVKVVGDGQHFEAIIISPDFVGQTRVKQHQMVYSALQAEMANSIRWYILHYKQKWHQKQFMLCLSKLILLKLGRLLGKLYKIKL